MSLDNILYDCQLCEEKIEDNFRVICPFCNVEICEKCFQYSLTMELKNPVCIYCKKKLSLEFVLSNNETNWCKKNFIPYFQNLCLEKEKSLLIDTLPKYKNMVDIRNIKKQINKLPSNKKIENEILSKLKKKYPSSITTKIIKSYEEFNDEFLIKKEEKDLQFIILNVKLSELESKDKSLKSSKLKKKIYICNCPVSKCRGFINENYICDICNAEICDSCLVKKEENHICNRDDVKSANVIKESSKPCPKCYVPIFKSSGCNQMFCTICHVVFDWETLKIDNGSVHNAHYFEWMTSQNEKVLNLEDVACGDIEDIYRNIIVKLNNKLNNCNNNLLDINKLIRFIKLVFNSNRIFNGEIIDLIRNSCLKNNFEKYRIEYLDNKITEESWKSKIAKDTINNEKYNSLIHVLEMYITVTSDLIRQFAYDKIFDFEFKNNYIEFVKHFIKSSNEILEIFGGNFTTRIEYLIFEYVSSYKY